MKRKNIYNIGDAGPGNLSSLDPSLDYFGSTGGLSATTASSSNIDWNNILSKALDYGGKYLTQSNQPTQVVIQPSPVYQPQAEPVYQTQQTPPTNSTAVNPYIPTNNSTFLLLGGAALVYMLMKNNKQG